LTNPQESKDDVANDKTAYDLIFKYTYKALSGSISNASILADMIAAKMVEHSVKPLNEESVLLLDMETWRRAVLDDTENDVNKGEALLTLKLIAGHKGLSYSEERVDGGIRQGARGVTGRHSRGVFRGRGHEDSQSDHDDASSMISGVNGESQEQRSPGGTGAHVRSKLKTERKDFMRDEHNVYEEYIHTELKNDRSIDDIIAKDKNAIARMCNKSYDMIHGHMKSARGGCKMCPNWLRQVFRQDVMPGMGKTTFPDKWDDYKKVVDEL
jgi:hypothetical protein